MLNQQFSTLALSLWFFATSYTHNRNRADCQWTFSMDGIFLIFKYLLHFMGWFQNKQNVITVQILGTPFQLMEICFQRWAIYKTVEILTLQKLPLLHLNFMIILLFQLSDQQFCGTKIFVCTWKKNVQRKKQKRNQCPFHVRNRQRFCLENRNSRLGLVSCGNRLSFSQFSPSLFFWRGWWWRPQKRQPKIMASI